MKIKETKDNNKNNKINERKGTKMEEGTITQKTSKQKTQNKTKNSSD